MIRIVHEALDLGIAGFDTAAAYGDGESEALLGRALRGRRETTLISTKIFGPVGSHDPTDWRPATLRRRIDESLRRLDTEFVDVLSIHRLDDGLPIEPVLIAMAEAQAAGKARELGTSSMSGDLLLEALIVADRLDIAIAFEQCKLSLLDRASEATVLPVARKYRVRASHYGVLEEGLLAGGSRSRRYESAVKVHPWPEAARRSLAEKRAVAKRLEQVAAGFGMTLLDLAVGFACLTHAAEGPPEPPTVILGVGHARQLAGLIQGTYHALPGEAIEAIDHLVPPGTAVGVPDRSRLRTAALSRIGRRSLPLVAGDPRQAQRTAANDRAQSEIDPTSSGSSGASWRKNRPSSSTN